MRLTDLEVKWVAAGGPGITRNGQPVPERRGVGIGFDCPCGCDQRCFVPFVNPLDGGPPTSVVAWTRTGDTFETLTLQPSIKRSRENGGCGWHGFITNGEVTGQVEP